MGMPQVGHGRVEAIGAASKLPGHQQGHDVSIPPTLILTLLMLAATSPAADLGGRLDRALATVPAGGQAALAVFDLTARGWLYRANIDQPLSLASTTKLITAAAALNGLGADYRFSTKLVALGPVQAGSLPGLGVIGGGDPSFDSEMQNDHPDQVFLNWAEQLKTAGVERIDGDLVVDNRFFSGPSRPPTWPQDPENLQRWYSAPASAFAWLDNCIEVRVLPTAIGQPATVEVRPFSERITARNLTRTVAGKNGKVVVSRERGGNAVTVSGTTGRPTDWFPLAIHNSPDLLAADHLKATLAHAGIVVSGEVRLGQVPATAAVLIDHQSPLAPALQRMLVNSQNFYAEQILRVLGAVRGNEGSTTVGCSTALDTLRAQLGPTIDEIDMLDGSGLSYDNRASAFALVKLLAAMRQGPNSAIFFTSLKSERWAKATGRVKTGTHAQSRALAGYITTGAGNVLAFAILLNRGDSRDIGWAVGMRDKLFRIIAEEVP